MATKTEVFKYMRAEIKYHVDITTGEVNSTTLAEDAYNYFHPNNNEGISNDHKYFDWAITVSEQYERETGVLPYHISGDVGGFINSIPGGYI